MGTGGHGLGECREGGQPGWGEPAAGTSGPTGELAAAHTWAGLSRSQEASVLFPTDRPPDSAVTSHPVQAKEELSELPRGTGRVSLHSAERGSLPAGAGQQVTFVPEEKPGVLRAGLRPGVEARPPDLGDAGNACVRPVWGAVRAPCPACGQSLSHSRARGEGGGLAEGVNRGLLPLALSPVQAAPRPAGGHGGWAEPSEQAGSAGKASWER